MEGTNSILWSNCAESNSVYHLTTASCDAFQKAKLLFIKVKELCQNRRIYVKGYARWWREQTLFKE